MRVEKLDTSGQLQSGALLITRLGIGMMMLSHGLPKLDMLLSGSDAIKFPGILGLSPVVSLGLAVFSEVLCSVLLMLGLFTRFSAAALAVTMLVAALVAHADDAFSVKEMSLHYLLTYVLLLLMGPGQFSLDQIFFNHSRKENGRLSV